jgi:hypothetical protein
MDTPDHDNRIWIVVLGQPCHGADSFDMNAETRESNQVRPAGAQSFEKGPARLPVKPEIENLDGILAGTAPATISNSRGSRQMNFSSARTPRRSERGFTRRMRITK